MYGINNFLSRSRRPTHSRYLIKSQYFTWETISVYLHEKMSDIHQRTKGKNRKFRFSYILFSSLIAFDIFAILNTIEPLVSGDSMDLQTNNSSMVETKKHRSEEEVIRLMVKEFRDFYAANNITLDLMAKMEIYLDWVDLTGAHKSTEVIVVTMEVFAYLLLLLVNLVALIGLKRGKACFLVPWMMIYFTGFCTCYFRGLLLLVEQANAKYYGPSITSIFYTLATGIVFNLAWVFVCIIFKELVKDQGESRLGLTPV